MKTTKTKSPVSLDMRKWIDMVKSQKDQADKISKTYPNLSRDRALEAIATACLGARSAAEESYRNKGSIAQALREACRILEEIAKEV